jgi:hypothetical protein
MKIEFSKEDVKKIIYDSFCNGGLIELANCSVQVDWDVETNHTNYIQAKERCQEKIEDGTICFEDVMIEILDSGKSIVFTDYEADESVEINIETSIKNLNDNANNYFELLSKFLDEEGDYDSFDCSDALQLCLYKDVIFC